MAVCFVSVIKKWQAIRGGLSAFFVCYGAGVQRAASLESMKRSAEGFSPAILILSRRSDAVASSSTCSRMKVMRKSCVAWSFSASAVS